MNEQTGNRTVAASPARVRQILLDAAAVPEWNPAIRSLAGPDRARLGEHYPVVVRGGLRGEITWTRIEAWRVEMRIAVPGFTEDGWWRLTPQDGGTLVAHGFSHRGPLAVVLTRAFRGVVELRLARLAGRVGRAAA
ncbi:MAG TPA: SRPBCC family protein [Natronosporangium sp.]|nr:SRPBCC family protein [Natronosporangium sp.]